MMVVSVPIGTREIPLDGARTTALSTLRSISLISLIWMMAYRRKKALKML